MKRSLVYLSIVVFTTAFVHYESCNPKVFVIGDSISIHYGPYLKQALTGFFKYDRKRDKGESLEDLDNPVGANGGDSKMVLTYLNELYQNKSLKTDYLLLNCGLHDIKRNSPSDLPQVPIKEYAENLGAIINLAQLMELKLIWLTSTPVVDSIHNSRVPFFRYERDIKAYNKVADSIMMESNIPVIDLYTFTRKFVPQGYMDHIHYKEDIRQQQADFIAGSLTAIRERYD